jgi:hypothetical protein
MKVGFSLGRCIRDIVNETVDYNDVVVIVAGTRFETEEQLTNIVNEYMYRDTYLYGLDEDKCQAVAKMLLQGGKIHQPRNYGIYRNMMPEDAVWADLIPTGGHTDPMVQEAWQAYRGMLGLTGNAPANADIIKQNWEI